MNILKNYFGMIKVNIKWVPKILTQFQKNQRVLMAKQMLGELENVDDIGSVFTQDETWIYHETSRKSMWILAGTVPPVIAKKSIVSAKTMISVALSFNGTFLVHSLSKGEKFTKKFYENNVISSLHDRLGGNRKRNVHNRVMLHMDNARPHLVDSALEDKGIRRLIHPPYSPDLAPCDFFLFGYLKKQLEGRKFQNEHDLLNEVKRILMTICSDVLLRVYQEWIRRLKKCIEVEGEYFE